MSALQHLTRLTQDSTSDEEMGMLAAVSPPEEGQRRRRLAFGAGLVTFAIGCALALSAASDAAGPVTAQPKEAVQESWGDWGDFSKMMDSAKETMHKTMEESGANDMMKKASDQYDKAMGDASDMMEKAKSSADMEKIKKQVTDEMNKAVEESKKEIGKQVKDSGLQDEMEKSMTEVTKAVEEGPSKEAVAALTKAEADAEKTLKDEAETATSGIKDAAEKATSGGD
eukprot:TRINITY_DN110245_c0_g1_i1.p1 TRINITY_DN110245_c0_g1~~TRINITY_DN110245_c0_g1_i1.p1  ORF type:complete len:257 (+),score=86.03 TRINITY_DN110245_c0_g1_i1:92-772(+)